MGACAKLLEPPTVKMVDGVPHITYTPAVGQPLPEAGGTTPVLFERRFPQKADKP